MIFPKPKLKFIQNVEQKTSQRKRPTADRSRHILHKHKSCAELRYIAAPLMCFSFFYTYTTVMIVPSCPDINVLQSRHTMSRRLIVLPLWSDCCTTAHETVQLSVPSSRRLPVQTGHAHTIRNPNQLATHRIKLQYSTNLYNQTVHSPMLGQ